MDLRCRVELFGKLRLIQADQITTRFRTQKAAAMLAYLALYLRQDHARERILDLFWPEMDLDAARNNLSTLLVSLRRQLEPIGVAQSSVLIADRRNIRLNAEVVTTDVAEFDALLKAAGKSSSFTEQGALLEQAVSLYRGDLLPGVYDDWAIQEQDRCRARYVDALVQWSRCLQNLGECEAALATLQRAIAADPYREEVYASQMRLQAALGNPASALETYQHLAHFLKESLGVTPGGEARTLAEQLSRNPQALLATKITHPVMTRPTVEAEKVPTRSVQRPDRAPSSSQSPTPLPLLLTRFFGREQELAQLETFVTDGSTRLLTLTGPGGMGKTRLAIEIAHRIAPAFARRVWFVSLADLTEPTLIPFALASALSLAASQRKDPLESVVEALGTDRCLLVLDNLEQLLRGGTNVAKGDGPNPGGAAAVVRLLLGRVPGLVCLTTSREPLHLEGEQEFPIAPLPLPLRKVAAEDLIRCSSVALFADRARLVRPDFTITESNREAVSMLCLRLEGMPLAIEMAAAWSNTHTPARILQRLEQQLDLLVSRRRDLPPRQQSLRVTIEWSYHLLLESERALLTRLSVFLGGWTEEAALAVCAEGERADESSALLPSPSAVRNALAGLVDKSLVRYEAGDTADRYRLLETVREYAGEKLKENGEAELLRARHQDYFLGFAEHAAALLMGPEQAVWLDRMESETDNFRAALNGKWAGVEGAERGLRLAGALLRFWHMRGHYTEGRAHLKRALEREGAQGETAARANALSGAGILAWAQSDYKAARVLYEQSVEIRNALGDRMGAAGTLCNLGVLAASQGDYREAEERYQECLISFEALGARAQAAVIYFNLGNLATNQAEYASALALYERSLALRRELKDTLGVAWCLHNLGCVANDQCRHTEGWALLQEGLALFRAVGDRQGIAASLTTLGSCASEQGDLSRAKPLFEESLILHRELGDRQAVAQTGNCLSRIASLEGEYAKAQALAEENLAIFRELGDRRGMALSFHNLGLVACHSGNDGEWQRWFAEALALNRELNNRKGVLENLEGMAVGFAAAGEIPKAVRLWGAAAKLRETLGVPVPPLDQEEYTRQLAHSHQTLGEAAYSTAWETGRALTCEEVADGLLIRIDCTY